MIGRGVAYRKMEETDLCWSATVEMGVLFIGRSVAYRKTGLHGILFISTVDPPPASTSYCSSTVDLLQPPQAPVHPASTVRYSTDYFSTTPLHGLLFNHPSTSYCSSSPPPSTVIQPSTGWSCSSSPPWGPVHPASTARYSTGYCSTTPPRPPLHRLLFIQPSTGSSCSSSPPRVLFIQPQPARSIGVLFIQRQRHGVLFIHPHCSLFIQTPLQRSLFI